MRLRMMFASAALVLAMLPHASLAGIEQSQGQLAHGGRYVIQRDATLPVAAIDLWFRAPQAGFDGATPGLARIAAAAAAASPLASGTSLADFVRNFGGRFSISVYPDLVGITAIVPAGVARRTVAAMSAAFFAANITPGALLQARHDTLIGYVNGLYSPQARLRDALFGALFTAGPAHDPAFPTKYKTLGSIPASLVRAYAQRAFRSSNATMSIVGNVAPNIVDAVTDGNARVPGDQPFDSTPASQPSVISLSARVGGVGLGWIGPPIDDTRAATAMDFLSDLLFRPTTGALQRLIAHAHLRAEVAGQFITLHASGTMILAIEGPDAQAAATLVRAHLADFAKPLAPTEFANAKAAFLYHLRADGETVDAIADDLGWYAAEGNAAYAPGNASDVYARAALSLDAVYVASVAARYLQHPTVITLVQTQKTST